MKPILSFLTVLISAVLITACGGDNEPTAYLRVLHASADAPGVDVLVDDVVAFNEVEFKQGSKYAGVDPGARNIKVNATGTSSTVIEADLNLVEGSEYTVIALNELADIEPLVLVDDTEDPVLGNLKVRVVHGAAGAPAVDVYVSEPEDNLADLSPTLSNVAFKDFSDFLEIPAKKYRIRLTLAGEKEAVFDSGKVALAPDAQWTLVAVDAEGLSPVSLVVLTRSKLKPAFEITDGRARVRAIHASPDAPEVDILVDNEVVLSSVPFKAASDYLTVLSGKRNFKVNAAGSNATVIDATPKLSAGIDYSLLALNFLSNIEPLLVVDDNSAPAPGNAKIRVIHASPDAPEVDVLVNDAAVLSNVAFKMASDYLEVPAASYNIKVNAAGTDITVIDADLSLEEGKVYTAIALGALADIEPLVLMSTSL